MSFLKQPTIYIKCAKHVMQSLLIQHGNNLVITLRAPMSNANNLEAITWWISEHYPNIELPIGSDEIDKITNSIKEEVELMSCSL